MSTEERKRGYGKGKRRLPTERKLTLVVRTPVEDSYTDVELGKMKRDVRT